MNKIDIISKPELSANNSDNINTNNFSQNKKSCKPIAINKNRNKFQELIEKIERLSESELNSSRLSHKSSNLSNNDRNSNFLYKSKIFSLQKKLNYANNTIQQLQSEISLLKNEIFKKDEVIKSKEKINNEYKIMLSDLRNFYPQNFVGDIQNKKLISKIYTLKRINNDYINEIEKNHLDIQNKNSIIELLQTELNEINKEIEQKMINIKNFETVTKNNINKLIRNEKLLKLQNNELSRNLSKANETLKQYNQYYNEKFETNEDYKNKICILNAKYYKLLNEYIKLKNALNFQNKLGEGKNKIIIKKIINKSVLCDRNNQYRNYNRSDSNFNRLHKNNSYMEFSHNNIIEDKEKDNKNKTYNKFKELPTSIKNKLENSDIQK